MPIEIKNLQKLYKVVYIMSQSTISNDVGAAAP